MKDRPTARPSRLWLPEPLVMLRSTLGYLSGGRRESGKTIHRAQAPSVGLINITK